MLGSLIEKIKSLFSPSGKGHEPYEFSTLDFPQVNLDEVASELRIREKAKANGQSDLPPEDAVRLDGPHREIRSNIKGRIRRVVAGYKRKLDGLTNEIRSYDIKGSYDRLRTADEKFEHDMADLSEDLRPKITSAQESLTGARDQFEKFKTKYQIERSPDYPDSHWWQWGVLLIVAVLQAFLNGYFFYQGMEQGIVGGAFVALVLASVDVMVVFFLGRTAVWLRYGQDAFHQGIGLATSAIFAAWALLYNLLTAHVRESLQGDVVMTVALEDARDSFLENPFLLEQADSFVLFLSGLVFSALAFYSGMSWDEKIPRYGKLHRRLLESREELEYWIQVYRNEASKKRNDALDMIEDTIFTAEGKITKLKNLIQTKDTLLTTVNQCILHHNESCKALMARYRDENMRVRSEPPPQYFNEEIEVKLIEAPQYDTEEDRDHLKKQKDYLEAIHKEAEGVRKRIRAIYQESLDQASELDTGNPGTTEESSKQEEEIVRESA